MLNFSNEHQSDFAQEQAGELARMARQQVAVLEISRAVQAIEHIDDLERVVRVMFKHMKNIALDFAGLAFQRLIDAETQTFEQHHMRPDGAYQKQVQSRPATFREWQAQRVLYRRDLSLPKYREGLPNDFQPPYEDLGVHIRCILHVPNRYGILTLRSETPQAFSDAQVRFVGDLAQILGLGISRVEDLERLAAGNAELRQANASLKAQILQRKQAEEALRESEERHRALFESSRDAIMTLAPPSWRFTSANPAALKMFGAATEAEFIALGPWELSPERQPDGRPSDVKAREMIETALREGSHYFEWTHRRLNGEDFPATVSLTRVELGGEPLFQATVCDITERKQMEQELIRLERVRALGEMSAGISHNLNNILSCVLGPAQLIQRFADDPRVREEAQEIIDGARRARELVHRLHLSTRGVAEDALQPVQVNQVIEETVQMLRPRWQDEPESRGIAVEVVTHLGEVPAIEGTETRLHDIIVNLLLNAVDAMPKGGTITIGTQAVGDRVQITVSDTGMGMDEETRRRVFEPFFTTKMDVGSGLGLSTVYGTVTQWGGTLDVVSAPGEGATFTIQLPAWKEKAAQVEAAAAPSRAVRRATLLIVDDDEGVCNLLSRFFGEDHEVASVHTGWEALERFAPGRYDVALIDQGMPGMPGDQVMREMHRVDPNLVTVSITGWEFGADDPRLSIYDFRIQQPFDDLERVEDVVAQAVRLHDARVQGKG